MDGHHTYTLFIIAIVIAFGITSSTSPIHPLMYKSQKCITKKEEHRSHPFFTTVISSQVIRSEWTELPERGAVAKAQRNGELGVCIRVAVTHRFSFFQNIRLLDRVLFCSTGEVGEEVIPSLP